MAKIIFTPINLANEQMVLDNSNKLIQYSQVLANEQMVLDNSNKSIQYSQVLPILVKMGGYEHALSRKSCPTLGLIYTNPGPGTLKGRQPCI